VLFLSVWLTACSSAEEIEKDKHFYTVINNCFGEYSPKEKVWINKPLNNYATAEVEKSKMSFGNFENIQKNLKDDG
jgi:Leu/Phe-tRNA-protein transferase